MLRECKCRLSVIISVRVCESVIHIAAVCGDCLIRIMILRCYHDTVIRQKVLLHDKSQV